MNGNLPKMLSSVAIFLTFSILQASSVDLEVVNQWNLLDFAFSYDYAFISQYRPENTVFTGLEITEDRIFLAMPRLRAGVPATLATIPKNTPPGSSPPLQPYPNWETHAIGKGDNSSCDGLTSVYRMRVDSCNRLWVLDSGIMTSLDDFTRVCPPKVVVYDLTTDQPVRTVVFPRQVLRPASLLTNLVIDESVQGTCDTSFVYITDTAAPGIVVYDAAKDTTWRVTHPSMYPDPDFSDYLVDGETFTLMDGIVGFSHSPKLATLFFQPLATDRIFSLATSALRKGPPAEGEVLPVALAGKKASQGLGLAVSERDDTLYFSPVAETSIASWNPLNNNQKLVAYDATRLQFPAELRWNAGDDSLWLLSTRLQKFFKRTVSGNEVNLRVIRIPLSTRLTNNFNNNQLYY